MKDRLKDYVLTIPGVLSKSLCKKIIKELKSSSWETQEFYVNRKGTSKHVSKGENSDKTFDIIPSDQSIKDEVWKAIYKYIIEEINFPWFPGWEGFCHLKFNRYQKNKSMDEHCDHIHSAFDGKRKGIPILSVIGALNSNYEGGELVMFQDKEYTLKTGEVLIFPSVFLYPHKIMPVTKGTRFTYVTWVY